MEILDYEDVSWIDKQDDGMEADSVKIQVVTSHRKKPPVGAPMAKPVAEWDSFMVRVSIFSSSYLQFSFGFHYFSPLLLFFVAVGS